MNSFDKDFWHVLEKLVKESEVIIDRPKGSTHPKYPDFFYELDYGYLEGTTSADGGGIDVWLGSNKDKILDAVIVIVDYLKRDSEIKILIGCNEDEKNKVLYMHNKTEFMKGLMIKRNQIL